MLARPADLTVTLDCREDGKKVMRARVRSEYAFVIDVANHKEAHGLMMRAVACEVTAKLRMRTSKTQQWASIKLVYQPQL